MTFKSLVKSFFLIFPLSLSFSLLFFFFPEFKREWGRRKNENWGKMCFIFMFCCKETEYCSFVLITKGVKRKKTFSILIKLCSLFCQGPGGESSAREMNEMESRSGQMHKHNQMLQGSRSSGKGLQHSSRKQTVVWHRRGDDVFPWGLRKAARNIIGRNYGRPKSEKGRKKLDWTRKRSKWIRDVRCSLARERIPSGKSQMYLVLFLAERKKRKLNQRTGKVIDPRSPMSSAQ